MLSCLDKMKSFFFKPIDVCVNPASKKPLITLLGKLVLRKKLGTSLKIPQICRALEKHLMQKRNNFTAGPSECTFQKKLFSKLDQVSKTQK